MQTDFEEGIGLLFLLTVESGKSNVVVEGLDASARRSTPEFQLMHLYKGY